jgi:hypothetical protein
LFEQFGLLPSFDRPLALRLRFSLTLTFPHLDLPQLICDMPPVCLQALHFAGLDRRLPQHFTFARDTLHFGPLLFAPQAYQAIANLPQL